MLTYAQEAGNTPKRVVRNEVNESKDDAIFQTAGENLSVPDPVRGASHSGNDLHRSSHGDAGAESGNGLPQFKALRGAGQDPAGNGHKRQRTLRCHLRRSRALPLSGVRGAAGPETSGCRKSNPDNSLRRGIPLYQTGHNDYRAVSSLRRELLNI